MASTYDLLFVSLLLFLGMVLAFGLGQWLGRRRPLSQDATTEVPNAVNGAIFAVLGLLLAFTFSAAYGRLDVRRHLIVQEANAISTAYLRLDLLPIETQPPLRDLFRAYAASRAALYGDLADSGQTQTELARSAALQMEIWHSATAAANCADCESTRLLLIPALNEMIDLVTTRTAAINSHPPMPIFVVLFALAMICSGLMGLRTGRTEQLGRLHSLLFAVVVSGLLYLILDIEYPRFGLVRLEHSNQTLVNLLQLMQ